MPTVRLHNHTGSSDMISLICAGRLLATSHDHVPCFTVKNEQLWHENVIDWCHISSFLPRPDQGLPCHASTFNNAHFCLLMLLTFEMFDLIQWYKLSNSKYSRKDYIDIIINHILKKFQSRHQNWEVQPASTISVVLQHTY